MSTGPLYATAIGGPLHRQVIHCASPETTGLTVIEKPSGASHHYLMVACGGRAVLEYRMLLENGGQPG